MRASSALLATTLVLGAAQAGQAADVTRPYDRDARGRVDDRRVMGNPPPVGRIIYNEGRPTEFTYVVHPLVPVEETRPERPIRARY